VDSDGVRGTRSRGPGADGRLGGGRDGSGADARSGAGGDPGAENGSGADGNIGETTPWLTSHPVGRNRSGLM